MTGASRSSRNVKARSITTDTFDRHRSPLENIDPKDPYKRASPELLSRINELRAANFHNGFDGPLHGNAYKADGELYRDLDTASDQGQSLTSIADHYNVHSFRVRATPVVGQGGLYLVANLPEAQRQVAILPNPSCAVSMKTFVEKETRQDTGPG